MVKDQPHRIETPVLHAARALRRAFDATLDVVGLNMTQAAPLRFVRDAGPLTQRELSDLLHLGRASIGELVVGLERRGLIYRRADPEDRRVCIVSLGPAALPLIEQFEALDEDLRKELRAGLTRSELRATAVVLERIETNAQSAIDRIPPHSPSILDEPMAKAPRFDPER